LQTHAIIDLSDSLAIIEVSGEMSRELLSEGCGVDCHEVAFQSG
jgi:sarcosine oxidase gamma subunit